MKLSIPNLVGADLDQLENVAANFWDALEVHFAGASPTVLQHLKEARRKADELSTEINAAIEAAKE